MRIQLVTCDQGVVLLACEGQLTQSGMELGRDPLEEVLPNRDFGQKVLLNLEKSTYIDSSGISWLIVCHKHCVQARGKMVLFNVPPLVMQVLQMLRLTLILNVASDEAAARQLAG